MSAAFAPTPRSASAGAGFPEPILTLPNNAQVVLASHWRIQELLRRKYSGSPSPVDQVDLTIYDQLLEYEELLIV